MSFYRFEGDVNMRTVTDPQECDFNCFMMFNNDWQKEVLHSTLLYLRNFSGFKGNLEAELLFLVPGS